MDKERMPAPTPTQSPRLRKYTISGIIQDIGIPPRSNKRNPPTDCDRSRVNNVTVLVHCARHRDIEHLARLKAVCNITDVGKSVGLIKLAFMVRTLATPDIDHLTAYGASPNLKE